MRLRDRIRRWWKPAQWQDDHPEASEGKRPDLHQEPGRVRVNVEGGGWRVFPGLVPDEADELAAELDEKKREAEDR